MIQFGAYVFAIAALVGPLLRFATWPPSRFEELAGTNAANFIYDLVFYLWPAQPLAVYEQSAGHVVALVLSIGMNIILFIFVGLVAGAAAAFRWSAVAVLYAVHCGLLVVFALWGAGFSIRYLSLLPLVVAMVLYAVPFWVVAKAAATRSRSSVSVRRNPS
jgi:hypothetical protein